VVKFVERIVLERPKFMQSQTDEKSYYESDDRRSDVINAKNVVQQKKYGQVDRRASSAGNDVSDQQMFG
jgi:hypothetical protein